MKKKGIISSCRNAEDSEVLEMLWPFFFIGLRLDNKPGALVHRILGDASPLDKNAVEREFNLSAMKDGQFIFSHQFAGHRCAQAKMFGAVLPLKVSGRQDVAKKLNELMDAYDLAYHGISQDDDWLRAIPAYKAIGLSIYEPSRNDLIRYDHALLKVTDADQGLSFLKHNEFRYVTAIGGMSNAEFGERAKAIPGITVDPERFLAEVKRPPEEAITAWQALLDESEASRHIAASAAVEWKDIADFSEWLSRGPGYEVDPKDVVVALVWENYD